ncbi:MAG: hypothetical protein Kow00103_10950 [Candidatus Caldatribacteriota bacterium]
MEKFFKIAFAIGLAVMILLWGGCSNLVEIFPFLNQAPVIVLNPPTTIEENKLYSYQIQAEDPEGDILSYNLVNYPAGMSIDKKTGLITWQPDYQQIGIFQVVVEVSDGKHTIQQEFQIEVINLNDPPQIISYFPKILNITISEGESINFKIQAQDLDKDSHLEVKWFIDGKLADYSSVEGNSIETIFKFISSQGDYKTKTIKGLISDGELVDYLIWNVNIQDTTPPQTPTLNSVVSPTNISPQLLTGTKEANSSLLINGIEVIALDDSTEWAYSYPLIEGMNYLSITSRDNFNNESTPLTVEIKYDLNVYVDAANLSGIEDGTETYPFNSINEGIETVPSGKKVLVRAGTYNEQITINKEIDLQGEGSENTFITGNGFSGNLITLGANSITISNFCLDGNNSTEVGIFFDSCDSIYLINNRITNQYYGIKYLNSSPLIEENSLDHNSYSGIEIGTGGRGEIRNNMIQNNQYGLRAYGNAAPEISGNNISNNSNSGIYCRESAVPIIDGNIISNNSTGILIDYNTTWGSVVNPDLGGGDGESKGENIISGNSIHGVNNKTPHPIKAENNWWGDTDGPKYPGNNSSSGDWVYWNQVNGTIDFDPWLTNIP